jgi:hypothetical protein
LFRLISAGLILLRFLKRRERVPIFREGNIASQATGLRSIKPAAGIVHAESFLADNTGRVCPVDIPFTKNPAHNCSTHGANG